MELQVFIQPGEMTSKLETSKFVLVKSVMKNPTDLKLKINLLQNLLEKNEISLEAQVQDLNMEVIEQDPMVELRKLRAG